MATMDDFAELEKTGSVRTFRHRQYGHKITGKVVGRGTSVVTDPNGKAARPWSVEDRGGNTHEIVPEDFDIE